MDLSRKRKVKEEDLESSVLPQSAAAGGQPVEMLRSLRDAPPAHYSFRIESFSLLSSLKFDNYESGVFEAGSYKWKLRLYPNGNKDGQGEGHVSLYLVIADIKALPLGWEVNANFKLFVYDYNRDKYLTIQDGRVRRFSGMRTEWGFDQLVSKEIFNDPSNGYILRNGSSVFGAKVFVIKSGGRKDECLSMIRNPANGIFKWEVVNFSGISVDYLESDAFYVDGWQWRIRIYPRGYSKAKDLSLSLFLVLKNSSTLPSEGKLYVNYKLRIWDRAYLNHREKEGHAAFTALDRNYGFSHFLALNDLKDLSKGFLFKDRVVVEAEILFLSVFKDF